MFKSRHFRMRISDQLFSDTLRALYLGDNDFEFLPPEIGKLKNLQIVSN